MVVETTTAVDCSSASSIGVVRAGSIFDEVAMVVSGVAEGSGNDHYFCCQKNKDYH